VKSRFDQKEALKLAAEYPEIRPDLAFRVYTSRLLGREPDLVLHGGGNTSVKLKAKDVLGEEIDVLYVKGSGLDLALIGPEGFTALDLAPLVRLRELTDLPAAETANQLQIRKLRAADPPPSLDALAHAFLPHRYVDHTHADSFLILSNQKHGPDLVREALGPKAAVLPYARPGFPLAQSLAQAYERNPEIEAAAALGHGLFTFGREAAEAYERMIEYVTRTEAYIAGKIKAKPLTVPRTEVIAPADPSGTAVRLIQMVRGACAHRAADGRLRRFVAELRSDPDIIAASLAAQAPDYCRSGVLTPDHAIRTKHQAVYLDRLPEEDQTLKQTVGRAVEAFVEAYEQYFTRHSRALAVKPDQLDPYPRVFLAAGLGLIALGFSRREARIAADIAEHTIKAKMLGFALGEYEAIGEEHVFDLEYWDLQQRKLDKGQDPLLQGQIALVTGGGGAIALGIADRLLNAGAIVVLADIDQPRLEKVRNRLAARHGGDRVETLAFDVTDYPAAAQAFGEISRRLGGVDLVVPNAGIAHVAKIEDLDPERLDLVMAVNFKGVFNVIKAAVPVFRRQGTGGNVVIISSKNVFDPGASFGAYSASKAAAHQLGKVAALELAELGVKVNLINPDAIFGDQEVSSKLWDVVGPDRMKARGLDPAGLREYYTQRNLLKTAVLAEHVGQAVVFFAADLAPITGAALPVDGGVPGAFPR